MTEIAVSVNGKQPWTCACIVNMLNYFPWYIPAAGRSRQLHCVTVRPVYLDASDGEIGTPCNLRLLYVEWRNVARFLIVHETVIRRLNNAFAVCMFDRHINPTIFQVSL